MSDVRRLICVGLVIWLGATLWGCSAEPFVPRTAGEACSASSECADSLCYESQCLDPARDDDNDGLTNAIEGQLGTDPLSADTDGDGLPDKIEVGTDIANPLNEDGDDFIDAVESNLVDTDGTPDCLVDQKDNPDLPPPEDKAALYNIGCCCGAPCDELGVSVNNEETECVFSEVDGVTMEVLACVTDEPDSDGDGVKDSCDWCSYLPDQSEDDPDGDNVCQLVDNCPLIANPVDDSEEQPDKDGDGLGDPCDPCVSAENDPDGDGVFNCFPSQCDPSEDAECVIDNCPEHHNPDQLDSDGDAAATAYGTDAYGGGDACDNDADNDGVDNDVDEDDDGDGVNDDLDNCPNTPNPADDEGVQLDTDGDGQGDACDPCPTLSVNDKDSDGFLDCDTDGDGDIEDPCVDEPEYVDGDNKPVCEDNCPEVANPSQFDSDGDGLGDACDDNPFVSDDIDGDGVLNDDDACPESPQAQAADQDLDGDGCFNSEDSDIDGDGVENPYDSCEDGETGWLSDLITDWDGDGCKDSGVESDQPGEDNDDDNDGLFDGDDECPAGDTEWDQEDNGLDNDQDGCQDATEDKDDDNDGLWDGDDECPTGATGWDQEDSDQDLDQDGCQDATEDEDDDGDGIADSEDTCPLDGSAKQTDTDGDGQGDACDADDDDDGLEDEGDNCPLAPNPGQEDTDGDSEGDACDADDDGDAVEDTLDNCPLTENAEQADLDQDGAGDSCDEDIDDDGVLNADDCAPDNPAVYGDAPELCNGFDDNCDGATDEGFVGLGDACDGDDADTCASGVIACADDGLSALCQDEAIDCSTLITTCRMGTCEPGSSEASDCVAEVDHGACADADPCTTDLCGAEDGQCTNALVNVNSPEADKSAASDAGCACVDNPPLAPALPSEAERVCDGLCLLKASCGHTGDAADAPEADPVCVSTCTETIASDATKLAQFACELVASSDAADAAPDDPTACAGSAAIDETCAPGGCTLPPDAECQAYCDALTACYPTGIEELVTAPFGNQLNYYLSTSPDTCLWGCVGFKAAGGFDLAANDGELQCQIELMETDACPADGLFPCGAPEQVCEESDDCYVWHGEDDEEGATGHLYEGVAVPEGITWDEAKAQAEAMGGHLATLNSYGEAIFVAANFSENGAGPWIGGRLSDPTSIDGHSEEEPIWEWVTGEIFDMSELLEALEGQEFDEDACLRLTHNGSFSWEAVPCTGTATGFLVEFLPSNEACEADTDFDEICDDVDNCPSVPNNVQADYDGDLIGDRCDNDADGDEFYNNASPFDCDDLDETSVPEPLYLDLDEDGYGDPETEYLGCPEGEATVTEGGDCADDDSSIYPGAQEICGDGVDTDCDEDHLEEALCGSSCEQLCTKLIATDCDEDAADPNTDGSSNANPNADDDGDEVLNGVDNCPNHFNPDQADSDQNGTGDECEGSHDDLLDMEGCLELCDIAFTFPEVAEEPVCVDEFEALKSCLTDEGEGFECDEEGEMAAGICGELQVTWLSCLDCHDSGEPDAAFDASLVSYDLNSGAVSRALCDINDVDRMWFDLGGTEAGSTAIFELRFEERGGESASLTVNVSNEAGETLVETLLSEWSPEGDLTFTTELTTGMRYQVTITPSGLTSEQSLQVRYQIVSDLCASQCKEGPDACGDDGCGGSCGECGEGFSCDGGLCVEACVQDCDGKACGPDGCGGSCGTCGEGQQCNLDSGACGPPPNSDQCDIHFVMVNGQYASENTWKVLDSQGLEVASGGPYSNDQTVESTIILSSGSYTLEMVDSWGDGWNPNQVTGEEAGLTISHLNAEDSILFGTISTGPSGDTPVSATEHFAIDCANCVLDCSEHVCGPNGCGGSCGVCDEGLVCHLGSCSTCVPSCEGKTCGDDGCGGSCGTCSGTEVCNAAGQCQKGDETCTPDCDGKVCGGDGCGGTCGACQGGQECAAMGHCVTEGTECVGNFSVTNGEELSAQLGHCEQVTGDLTLSSDVPSFLLSLFGLKRVTGSFRIEDTNDLSSLIGLSDLEEVGGDLWIDNNQSLTSLSAASNLTSVGGHLRVTSNVALTDLGLASLSSVGVGATIGWNPLLCQTDVDNFVMSEQLTIQGMVSHTAGNTGLCPCSGNLIVNGEGSMEALESISDCGTFNGSITIQGDAVESLEVLGALTEITGNLNIVGTMNLVNLQGLGNLKTIGGSFGVGYNDKLSDMSALGLESVSAGALEIWDNPKLQNLGLAQLQYVGTYISVTNNAWLCESDTQAFLGSELIQFGGPPQVTIQDNTGACGPCEGNLDENGKRQIFVTEPDAGFALDALQSCQIINASLNILGTQLTDLDALSGLEVLQGELHIGSNPNLTTVNLPTLETVDLLINVVDNPALETFSLPSLQPQNSSSGAVTFNFDHTALCQADLISWIQAFGESAIQGVINENTGGCDGAGGQGCAAIGCESGYLCDTQTNQCVIDCAGDHFVTGEAEAYLEALQSCSTIGGNLLIQGTTITHLYTQLDGIEHIAGDLVVSNNPRLEELALQYLNAIGGSLIIHSNGLLSVFHSVGGLQIGGDVEVHHNVRLCLNDLEMLFLETLEESIGGTISLSPGNDGCIPCTPECQEGSCGVDNGCGGLCECLQGEECIDTTCHPPANLTCQPDTSEEIDCQVHACPEGVSSVACHGEDSAYEGVDTSFLVIERDGVGVCQNDGAAGSMDNGAAAGAWDAQGGWQDCMDRRSGHVGLSAAIDACGGSSEPALTLNIIGVFELEMPGAGVQCRWLCDSNTCSVSDNQENSFYGPVYTKCGDGVHLGGAEECDDGNNAAGDGCDPFCMLEPEPCTPDCSSVLCGESIDDGCGGTCGCGEGWTCNPLNASCDDLDECALPSNECDDDALCHNIQGDYGCTCKVGFVGSGTVCECLPSCAPGHCGDDGCGGSCGCAEGEICDQNTNTCSEGGGEHGACTSDADCPENAVCNNGLDQEPHCVCTEGYMFDGAGQCANINECALGIAQCEANEICEDSTPDLHPLGYSCVVCNPDPAECAGLCGDYTDNCGNPCTCSDGQECTASGVCEYTGAGGCTSDGECPEGEMCASGMCVPGEGTGCTSDENCPVGMTCDLSSGVCM